MEAFWYAALMNFLAELGDKTQLVTLTFATRFNAWIVLLAVTAGTAASRGLSVLLGGLLGKVIPLDWVRLVAGIAFIGFGMWTLKDDDDDEAAATSNARPLSPFWLVSTTFFIAEMGDKTMLGTAALAATHPILYVFLGGTVGMVASDGLAILIGKTLGSRLPERAIKVGATAVFFLFGAITIYQSSAALGLWAWAAAILSLAVLAYKMFFWRQNKASGI